MKTMNKFFLTTSLLILSTTVSKAESVYMCEPCPAGYSCDKGVKTLCPAGTYSNAAATSCTKCPAGTYNPSTGGNSQNVCKACPAYQWSDAGSPKCGQVFVAMTNVGCGSTSPYKVEWMNIESFIDNRYMVNGIKHMFLFRHYNLYTGDINTRDDCGNFGTKPTNPLTHEYDDNDWMKGDCKTFPCKIQSSWSSNSWAIIDPANKVIHQHDLWKGSNSNTDEIKDAIVIDYNYKPGTNYKGKKPE